MSANGSASSLAMTEGRRADSLRRRQRVLKALNDAGKDRDEISVSGVARRAGVDRSFLYRHSDLLEQIHATQRQPNRPGVGPTVSRASLQSDLLNAQQRVARLSARVQQLERRLSEALGEQAWRESGLGAPEDIDRLQQRIVTLEQQVVELRLELEERDQELDAARAANRELMTRLNAPATRRQLQRP
jgi:uncharacterized protein YceH (UPF0502 family)